MSAISTETRSLKMHNKLLMDVIKRQAGTLEKAVLEGVMNGIEAGGNQIDINIRQEDDKYFLTIRDNGNGIKTADEIEQFFETFGTPHDESEGKVWAQFRMGRGQLFSFGKNIWRTGTFRMTVDINNRGLEYDLEQNLDEYDGCEIEVELYNGLPYHYSNIDGFQRAITEQVEFMPNVIKVNGQRVNRDPSLLEWTYEDDDAYYLIGVGSDVALYNLGAFCMKLQQYQVGVTGVVVSKKQLKVNFARNSVQSDCDIFQRIKNVLGKHRRKRCTDRKSALSREERLALLSDVNNAEVTWKDIKNVTLVPTAVGRALKLSDILRSGLPWSFAETDNIKADKLMQSNQAIIFDKQIKESLRYSGDDSMFFEWLLGNIIEIHAPQDYLSKVEKKLVKQLTAMKNMHVSFSRVSEELNESYIVLAHDDLTKFERCLIKTLESYFCWLGRRILIGVSATASAWTDGSSFIALDRQFIADNNPRHPSGAAVIVNVLVHELAHNVDTRGTHTHGEEFYRNFHDLCVRTQDPPQRIIADFRSRMSSMKRFDANEEEKEREKKEKERRDRMLAASSK